MRCHACHCHYVALSQLHASELVGHVLFMQDGNHAIVRTELVAAPLVGNELHIVVDVDGRGERSHPWFKVANLKVEKLTATSMAIKYSPNIGFVAVEVKE